VIDLAAVLELVEAGAERISWSRGKTEPVPSGGAGPAVLVVTEVTDAVKKVEGGRVVGSLDRDGLWAIRSIELDSDVFRRLSTERMDVAALIEKVDEAGYRWRVIPLSPSDP
jgi:hypothetical protein